MGRVFVVHAGIALVPVLLLGMVLAWHYQVDARRRGLAEAKSAAAMVSQTAVEPLLQAHLLSEGLTHDERAGLDKLTGQTATGHDILRLRIRDLDGKVVYSDDGSGLTDKPDPDAVEAAKGESVASLTHLNKDENDTGPAGQAAVEVYRVLKAGDPAKPVGVLEMYLSYAPIKKDVAAGLGGLYRILGIGLGFLYLALLGIAVSVSRGLRKEVKHNAFLAQHDNLTDLPNRSLFHERARAAVKASRRKHQAAIAIIDLDRFKDVNDTLGHHNGDRLLAELARRLDLHTRPGDTVARLGGDEFGVILADAEDAEEALWRLRSLIEQEIEVSGLPLSVEASIGYVLAPQDGKDVDDLLQRADVAMYVAKERHSGVVRYDPDQDDYDASNLNLIAELRHAIDAGHLELHYQPKAELRTGRIKAVEALVRWRHPERGLLLPDTFLPLAEQTDLIDKLTEWVLRTALTHARAIGGEGANDIAVAVNVSARSVGRVDFASRVRAALHDIGVPAERLIIEITETALLTDPARAATALAELDAAGVRVSLDDFGKGQTSLGYLSALPVHELKIDMSFVIDMLENPAHAAIVRSIVDLGHNLKLVVVAEGVETEAVRDSLRDVGCDIMQGFLLARPMPLAKLKTWLRERSGEPGRRARSRPLSPKRRVPVR